MGLYAAAVVLAIAALAVGVAHAADVNCETASKYCQNGGICHEPAGGAGWKTPACECASPYAGPACDWRIRECSDNPCKNGGSCIPASCQPIGNAALGFQSYQSQQYECFRCECKVGWGGSPFYTDGDGSLPTSNVWNAGGLCDYPLPHDDCTVNSARCQNGGTCISINTPTKSTFRCDCPSGWDTQIEDGWNCTVPTFNCDPSVTQGAVQPCLHGGTCPGQFTACSCPSPYGGDRCEKAFCASSPCQNAGTCISQANGNGFCSCLGSYVGGVSDPFCTKLQFCASNPCQNGATCSQPNFDGGLTGLCTCVANSGFNGPFCAVPKFCSSNPCQNGATCVDDTTPGNAGGLGSCQGCPAGFSGTYCEKPIGGCAITGCDHGGVCPCRDAVSCAAGPPSTRSKSTCTCQSNSLDGKNTFAGCACNVTRTLQCPPTNVVVPSTYTGQDLLNPSDADNKCQNGGTCFEWSDGTGCTCRSGFWGEKCEFYDNPCFNYPCQNGGRCEVIGDTGTSTLNPLGTFALTDRYWGYRCSCKYPFFGENCEFEWNPTTPLATLCAGNNCQNGATCVKRAYHPSGGFIAQNIDSVQYSVQPYACECATGFSGIQCERPDQSCATAGICGTGAGAGTCVQSGSSVVCQCPCGWSGANCEIAADNYDASNKGMGPTLLNFCHDGNSACQNGATCLNTVDGQGFTCACRAGFAGRYCSYFAHSAGVAAAPSTFVVAAAAMIVAAFIGRL